MPALEISPLAGSLGAEIRGVDLGAPIDDDTFAAIHRAYLEHHVVFFPKQSLDPAEHVAFGRRFGELTPAHPILPPLEGHPEVLVLDSSQGGKANEWHTDVTFVERPPAGSILHAQVVPEHGGDTQWANLEKAHDGLSEPLRRLCTGLVAIHDAREVFGSYQDRNVARDEDWRRKALEMPQVEHPVVRIHPETGRRCLFVNPGFTRSIKGFSRRESDGLLQLLFEHSVQPEYVVRWRWSSGDVVMWDNRCTMHYAIDDYGTAPRRVHRVTIRGERPVGPAPAE